MLPTAEPSAPVDLRVPTRPEALGVSLSLVEDLVMRRVARDGRIGSPALADALHISMGVLEPVLATLRDRRCIEFDGMDGRSFVVACTEAGRSFAQARSLECRYTGPVPVSLGVYEQVVREQRAVVHLDRDRLTRSFSDLVVAPELIDALGPAICGSGAMFLYGPPGTGKSSIAERIIRAYEDVVLVPYCIEVEGQIIAVYDPTIHDPVPDQPPGMDRRWVACHRPAVVAGGELHVGMLDLQLERDTGVYLAPLQLKANNGVFVIDDFGRQAMTPDALLNRWIVPLDRGVDYLTLLGRKFSVPFELKVVLSTNLDPSALGDEAFFRRIHNKVFVGAATDDQFDWILSRVAQKRGIACDEASAKRLRQQARSRGDGELRAYLPGVVCDLALAITRYENLPPVLSPALVDRVLDLYYTRSDVPSPASTPVAAVTAPSPPVATSPPVPSADTGVGALAGAPA